jgi:hypothetical protein
MRACGTLEAIGEEAEVDERRSRHPALTVVHVAQGLLKAHVIKAKLEEAGIPVLLEYESAGPVIGVTVDGLGEVRVLVPLRYADQARALIVE